ncbi:MAG: VCBS repeat-containing protein [Muribaculaceae bacterium]|nr:VCBS repeat-containing protein [Muribaculaceae bacterium]
MKKITVLLLLWSALTLTAVAAEWQMKQGPMMTPWSETLDPANTLPEYPRPQMVRDAWMNLNGVWDLRKGVKDEAYSNTMAYDKKILVPFPIESALSGVMEKSDEQIYWYRRTFTLPAAMTGKHILLHFGAVDWETVVYVNGQRVGRHTGGYDPFWFDITDALRGSGEQELAVYIYDNTGVEGQPTGKQSKNPSICWYTAVSGIWQTVWLEPVDATHITQLEMEPCLDRSWLSLRVNTTVTDGVTLEATVTDRDGVVVATGSGAPGAIFRLTLSSVHTWSPDDPYLYDVTVRAVKGGTTVDQVASYCGMRKIEVKKDDRNIPRIYLNNEQIFQMGPLDQGWWPDGLYRPASDDALYFDVKAMKDLGFNMVRKHIKIEPARWYYWCDRLGLLVWQDLPSPNLPKGSEEFAKANFEDEVVHIIPAIKNAPSIIHWVVFNEGWGQFDTDRMTTLVDNKVNALTPSRFGKASLICCASGWTDSEIGNIIDTHSYPNPSCPQNANRASVCGEYGGITLKVPGHIWPGGDFQYTVVETSQDFSTYFNGLCDKIKDMYYQGLNAAVYTQISDVEIEKNGFYTYDRRILKPYEPYTLVHDKILECIAMPQSSMIIKPILSTAQQHHYTWRYVTTDPDSRHWSDVDYDDSAWPQGKGAFSHGLNSSWDGLTMTDWHTNQIYMRRWFRLGDITPENLAKLRFMVFHDDDIEIFINGVWAATESGCNFNYAPLDISSEALQSLQPGEWNLIAIAGKQGSGQQVMDVGIAAFTTADFDYVEDYTERTDAPYASHPQPGTAVKPQFTTISQPVPAEPRQNGVLPGRFYHTSDRSNVAWGDEDGDGVLELVYSGLNEHLTGSSQQASLFYRQTADHLFERTASPFAVTYYACPVWIDYNNDGLLDLFVPGLASKTITAPGDMVAHLYKNLGGSRFVEVNEGGAMGIAPLYNATDGGRGRHWVSVGDYDNDGWTDIVVCGREDYVNAEGFLASDHRVTRLYRNDGGQRFVEVATPLNGTSPLRGLARGSVNFADMDSDGWLDIVATGYDANEGAMHIYWNNGDGTFSETAQRFFGSYDASCVPADFDADGLMDILVTGFSSNKGGNAKSVFIYRNRGNRSFAMLGDSYCGFEGVDGSTPAVADVNHDGRPDILLGGHGQEHEITTWLYLNRGDFAFEPFGAYYSDPFGKEWAFDRISHGNTHLIDYDGDGYLDAWSAGWAQSSVCSKACSAMLYRNTSAAAGITANQPPTAPTGLTARYDAGKRQVTLSWQPATDDVTPAAALHYNIWLRRVGSNETFMTVPAVMTNGTLRIGDYSGQLTTTSHTISITDPKATYEWGVQAIDGGKRAGAFATGRFVPSKNTGLNKKKADAVAEVTARDGHIAYQSPRQSQLTVYNAAGAVVLSTTVSGSGTLPCALPHGIYVAQLSSQSFRIAL